MIGTDIDSISFNSQKYNFRFFIYSYFIDKKNPVSEKKHRFSQGHSETKWLGGISFNNQIKWDQTMFIYKNMKGHGLMYYALNSLYVSAE